MYVIYIITYIVLLLWYYIKLYYMPWQYLIYHNIHVFTYISHMYFSLTAALIFLHVPPYFFKVTYN